MCFLLVVILFVPLTVQAEMFQWVDGNGKKHFSDRFHPGASSLNIKKRGLLENRESTALKTEKSSRYTYHYVKKVYDGDTILLANGKKVRFLGINTPEVENQNKSAQAGGKEAKHWLQNRLKNQKVRLETDIELKDKYGRFLGHIFTGNNQHINVELVRQGLATANIYPPNLQYTDKLLRAQQQAEQSLLGIWRYKAYAAKEMGQITQSNYKGWQRVTGVIRTIRHTAKNIYIKFNDHFTIKINRKYFTYFPELDSYVGKKLEVRGWITQHKNQYSMFVRHSSAIKVD